MNLSLRITGCILIVVSATMVGYLLSNKLKCRKVFIMSFSDFLCNLETNIRFSGEDIYSLIRKSAINSYLMMFRNNEQLSIKEYWSDCLKKIPYSYGLTKEDFDLLCNFGSILGSTDVEGQVNHIELYKNLFSSQLKKAEEEYIAKSKLYKVLGFFVGASIALMII